MNKFLIPVLVLLFVVIGAELWLYSLLNQKQTTILKNIPVQELSINPTLQPTIDPFKLKPWQLTNIQSFSDKNNQIEAAIVAVEKNSSSSSALSIRLINNQTGSVKIDSNTKFYSRTIPKNGFSSTKQEDTPFPIDKNMLLLLTWKQGDFSDGQIVSLTITRQL